MTDGIEVLQIIACRCVALCDHPSTTTTAVCRCTFTCPEIDTNEGWYKPRQIWFEDVADPELVVPVSVPQHVAGRGVELAGT
jgi:hypothetical protein